jgi:hypothetical protein
MTTAVKLTRSGTAARTAAIRQQFERDLPIGEWETAETPAAPQQDKPAGPRDWSIGQIVTALSKPLPQSILKQRKQGGATLDYIPWHTVNRILDKYAPGFFWEITNITTTPDRLVLVGRLTIPASDGDFCREATGTEALKEEYFDKEAGEKRLREIAYGDVSANAESQCFRRCAARFGLGLYLYSEKK